MLGKPTGPHMERSSREGLGRTLDNSMWDSSYPSGPSGTAWLETERSHSTFIQGQGTCGAKEGVEREGERARDKSGGGEAQTKKEDREGTGGARVCSEVPRVVDAA